MDDYGAAWHSRWMFVRPSVRRLILAFLLAQAMSIQSLGVAWHGALAAAGGTVLGFAVLCNGSASDSQADKGSNQFPVTPDSHQDCLSACVAGSVADTAPDSAVPAVSYAFAVALSILQERARVEMSEVRGFSARAPPMLL